MAYRMLCNIKSLKKRVMSVERYGVKVLVKNMKYKCLSIAGFDGSGGAGIQADLKTFAATGCYGLTILTALPAQNTLGVKSCHKISLTCIKDQLEAVFEDITPDAIKIGMLFSEEIIVISLPVLLILSDQILRRIRLPPVRKKMIFYPARLNLC